VRVEVVDPSSAVGLRERVVLLEYELGVVSAEAPVDLQAELDQVVVGGHAHEHFVLLDVVPPAEHLLAAGRRRCGPVGRRDLRQSLGALL